jgi:membrane-bound lytic murein transglycosylase B
MLAILQIETKCGQVTGNAIAFHRLSRLASATARDSIEDSYKMNLKERPETTMEEVEKRAKKLQDIFLPQAVATIKLADLNRVHPLEIKGSYAGAIGYPQFLPNNVFVYGVDTNGNGVIDLHNAPDAIHSIGNFLKQHGWKKKNYTKAEKEKIILHYNRSTPYAQTVVAMADILSSMMAGNPNPKDPPTATKKKVQNAKKAKSAKPATTKPAQKK